MGAFEAGMGQQRKKQALHFAAHARTESARRDTFSITGILQAIVLHALPLNSRKQAIVFVPNETMR
eukprot:129991-Amphidinium_carterae.1